MAKEGFRSERDVGSWELQLSAARELQRKVYGTWHAIFPWQTRCKVSVSEICVLLYFALFLSLTFPHLEEGKDCITCDLTVSPGRIIAPNLSPTISLRIALPGCSFSGDESAATANAQTAVAAMVTAGTTMSAMEAVSTTVVFSEGAVQLTKDIIGPFDSLLKSLDGFVKIVDGISEVISTKHVFRVIVPFLTHSTTCIRSIHT